MHRSLAPGLLALVAAGCLDGGEPAPGERRSAIYHGVRARGFVGTVRVKKLREAFGFNSCSGTVVAPRVVLTARHCLEDAQPIDLSVETGSEPEVTGLDGRRALELAERITDAIRAQSW
jgi:hypothetical protein